MVLAKIKRDNTCKLLSTYYLMNMKLLLLYCLSQMLVYHVICFHVEPCNVTFELFLGPAK